MCVKHLLCLHLRVLHSELRRLEEKAVVLLAERQIWLEYKNVGRLEHLQQIRHLEDELARMQRGYQDMADNIKRSLKVTFNEIDKKTIHLIDEKKHLATEKAVKHLDKHSKQEIRENEWLQRELAVYKKEVSLTEVAVQKLEEENLEHMSQLFEQRLDYLEISRHVFLTQVAGLGPCESSERAVNREVLSSPATGPDARGAEGHGRELEGDETDGSCRFAAPQPTEPPLRDLSVLLYGSKTHVQGEPMHLGPLEQKLLSVVGQAVPLHPLPAEESSSPGSHGSSAPGLPQAPEDWPLTARIIHNRFK